MSIRKNIDGLLSKFEKEFVTLNNIEVSQSALQHNVTAFAQLSQKQVIPVLKGNAYGHGIAQVARALIGQNIPYIAVDGYFEALRIREVSPQPVLIMGAILPQNFGRMTYDNFAFVVQDEAAIHGLGKTGRPIKVHLEVNTGMNRYGARPADVEELISLIAHYKNLELEGIMSHLADSDGEDAGTVMAAVQQFDQCIEAIQASGANPRIIHIAQTAGTLKASSRYANTIRLGIGLYGINPYPFSHTLHNQIAGSLQPALRLSSTIIKVIDLQAGEKVSYNYTFTAPQAMRIAVLPIGYYEGVNRMLSNRGFIKIGDTYCPIVGRVCMNHTIINIDGVDASVGTQVIVYSNETTDKNSIDGTAREYNLFSYNLLTALSSDVRRSLTA